jgi:integrase
MPRLTEARIRAAYAKDQEYKLSDGRGLHLLVKQSWPAGSGSKLWRYRYRLGGRENMLSLGPWPDVSLKRARELLDENRRLVRDGVNPATLRRAERQSSADTFKAVATEWLGKQKLAPATLEKINWALRDHLFPRLGSKPVSSIDAPELLATLRPLEARGKVETAHHARRLAGRVFKYAVITGRAQNNPAANLTGALASNKGTGRAAITDPRRVGELLRAIDGYIGRGQASAEYALKLLPYVFVRPGELRGARWSEFDLEAAEWRIPADRMKMKEVHIVPLARQVVDLLHDLQAINGSGPYLFPGLGTSERTISENTLNATLRRIGYSKQEMTAHGFRAMASTLLNEQGFPPDVIELQLAHKERNKVRAAYNRSQRLPERRKLLQAWADYLDVLKQADESKVVNLRGAKSA